MFLVAEQYIFLNSAEKSAEHVLFLFLKELLTRFLLNYILSF